MFRGMFPLAVPRVLILKICSYLVNDITHCFHIPRWGDVNISGDNVGEFPCQIKSDGNKLIFPPGCCLCVIRLDGNYLNFHFCWSGRDRRLVIKSQLLSIAPE